MLKRRGKILAMAMAIGLLLSACAFVVVPGQTPGLGDKPETEETGSGSRTEETVKDTQDNEGSDKETEIGDTSNAGTTEDEPEETKILISAVGDCTLGTNQKQKYAGSFHEFYDTYGKDYFLQHVKHIFEADDFTIVNLEGTLTDSTNIRPHKEWNHKGRPEYAKILSEASVEAVTLGNNHIMDYQQDGVRDTIKYVTEAGMAYALNSDWGSHVGLYEVKGIRIGFVSVNEYYEGKTVYQKLKNGYDELKEQGADIVIAANHWGGDKVHEVEKDQVDLGHWCIDQGFDLVLGCHPHVLQGIEVYNGRYIVYSMGNFCYGGNRNPSDKDSMIFQIELTFRDGKLTEDSVAKVISCRLSSVTNRNDYSPVILTGEKGNEVLKKMREYSKDYGTIILDDGSVLAPDEV